MQINPSVKKTGQFVLKYAKRVRPGHIMFGTMLVMTCMSKCSNTHHPSKSPAEYMQWAYEKGVQHTQDSMKIVELQNKIMADSMKYVHNLPK